ncbi:secondary thiamine-phosphate synthase enzyme YjbQ [Desulfovibrionales bacterium]
MITFSVTTTQRETMIDITPQLRDLVSTHAHNASAMLVYTPHTTTGLTINEGADPDVCRDILTHLRTLFPQRADFRHAEGNSDAHLKASFFGSSVHLMVDQGRLALGTWQRVFLGEFDGPRTRSVWVSFL